MSQPNPIAPWYKQPWLWFILAPLIATLMYSTVFISASIFTRDTLVKDDYYKYAREVNQDNTLIQAAADLGISVVLKIDTLTGDVSIQLDSIDKAVQPQQLKLELVHATLADRDIQVNLRQVRDGLYLGSLPAKPLGKQYVIVQPDDLSWQLRQTIFPPYEDNQFDLIPRKSS